MEVEVEGRRWVGVFVVLAWDRIPYMRWLALFEKRDVRLTARVISCAAILCRNNPVAVDCLPCRDVAKPAESQHSRAAMHLGQTLAPNEPDQQSIQAREMRWLKLIDAVHVWAPKTKELMAVERDGWMRGVGSLDGIYTSRHGHVGQRLVVVELAVGRGIPAARDH